ncbi:MAG: crotonase/enoyl-CoA hydratase family protein [Pseudomonadota bacterium]
MSVTVEADGPVRILRIDRPAARCAVDPATATLLYDAVLAADRDDAIAAIVLTGTDGAFCAGFDLKQAATGLDEGWYARHDIPDDWSDPVSDPLPGPMGPSRLMPVKPVIAAIEGPAVAGGMELAAWCHMRVAARDAFLGVFCRRWGVPLLDGGTVRLPRILGQGRANDLILTGRKVMAEEALAMGLVDRLVAPGEALEGAIALARDLIRFPQACLRADLASAQPAPAELAAALRREWVSTAAFRAEGHAGAGRFRDGLGRSGDFSAI